MRERGYKPRQSFWELDHIVPLIDGGSHDDENLQTLCTPCHAAKTAGEARVRATRSHTRPEKEVVKSKGRPAQTFDEMIEAADVVNARVAEALAEIASNQEPAL